MTMQMTVLMLLIAFAAVSSTGCATHDRRDAAWDPKPGETLLDQIPNEISASRRCCGHLRQCKVNQSPRC